VVIPSEDLHLVDNQTVGGETDNAAHLVVTDHWYTLSYTAADECYPRLLLGLYI
jgi:hypothetical protein